MRHPNRRRGARLMAVVLVAVLSACSTEPTPPLSPEATEGRSVAEEAGCLVCHSTDGSRGTGPTFAGLYKSEVPLTDGSTAIADEEYLRRSILDPTAEVVEGFTPLMPTDFSERLNEDDISALISYITELK